MQDIGGFKIKKVTGYKNIDELKRKLRDAGAVGLNLQKSNKIIYFSLPLSSELFEQSKKRTHRIGQKSIEEKYLG